jgi:parallel beta-helix repeat protein
MSNITTPLNLKTLSIAAVAIVLMCFGKFFAVFIPSLCLIGTGQFSLLAYANIQQSVSWAQWVSPIIGASILAVLFIRSRGHINKKLTKTQLVNVSTIFTVITVVSMVCATPAAQAATTATTGFVLDVPFSDFAYLIGHFGNPVVMGAYYVINGSDWDALTTGGGSTEWSAYANNSTKLAELCLANTGGNGTIVMVDVYFPLELMDSIPANVTVRCQVNGVTTEFTNPANSQGSPYTIRVGQGVTSGYYTAEDAKGRICYASTAWNTVFAALNVMQNIQINIAAGTYLSSTTGTQPDLGEGNHVIGAGFSNTIIRKTGDVISGYNFMGANNSEIRKLTIDFQHLCGGLDFQLCQNVIIEDCNITGVSDSGYHLIRIVGNANWEASNIWIHRNILSTGGDDTIGLEGEWSRNCTISENTISDAYDSGIEPDDSASYINILFNNIFNCGAPGNDGIDIHCHRTTDGGSTSPVANWRPCEGDLIEGNTLWKNTIGVSGLAPSGTVWEGLTHNIRIVNNRVFGGAIALSRVDGAIITGNQITASPLSTGSLVLSNASAVTATSNLIKYSQRCGIYMINVNQSTIALNTIESVSTNRVYSDPAFYMISCKNNNIEGNTIGDIIYPAVALTANADVGATILYVTNANYFEKGALINIDASGTNQFALITDISENDTLTISTALTSAVDEGDSVIKYYSTSYGFDLFSGVTNCNFANNIFGLTVSGALHQYDSTTANGNKFSNNIGLVSDKRFTNENNDTATTIVFSHGCAKTPTIVEVQWDCPAYIASWSASSDATQTTITYIPIAGIPATVTARNIHVWI